MSLAPGWATGRSHPWGPRQPAIASGEQGLELRYPNEPVIQRGLRPSDLNETWGITLEEANTKIVQGTAGPHQARTQLVCGAVRVRGEVEGTRPPWCAGVGTGRLRGSGGLDGQHGDLPTGRASRCGPCGRHLRRPIAGPEQTMKPPGPSRNQ